MVVHARRNGQEPQASTMLRHRSHADDIVHRTQDLIDDRLAEPLPLAYLARCRVIVTDAWAAVA
jgi:transcriptional regulator GlxA family with amidase domain